MYLGEEPAVQKANRRELGPAADVVILDEVGHYPQLEAAKAVLDGYLGFRERLGAEGALRSSPA